MVRLVLLDEDVDAPDQAGALSPTSLVKAGSNGHDGASDGRPNPNLNQFSAALCCYPIVSQLAQYLDLTALHELSRTCRQVRADLLQYRTQLIAQTLRCENESVDRARQLGQALHTSQAAWTAFGRNGEKAGRITSGKVGACARDMVGECRRCGKVVCRNCVIKTPPTKARHRRLCRTCMKSPLDLLTTTTDDEAADDDNDDNDAAAAAANEPWDASSNSNNPAEAHHQATRLARDPCTCETAGAWLCQGCGLTLRTADTTYRGGWRWRTRYSVCGGLGAGLGEGNEGVECGRTRRCLAARKVEKDVECGAAEMAARGWEGGGSYATQEVVDAGGKVKNMVRKRVPVGAVVKEYEDERVTEDFLGREQRGLNRSWCSWCARVVLGKRDVDAASVSRESLGSASSRGSLM